MNKKFLLGLLAVVVLGGLAVMLAYRFNDPNRIGIGPRTKQDVAEVRKRLFGEDTNQPASMVKTLIDISRPHRLAIGGLGLGNDEKNRNVADLTLANLGGAARLDLVERQSLEAVLRELNLNASGLVRAKDAVKVGKLVARSHSDSHPAIPLALARWAC